MPIFGQHQTGQRLFLSGVGAIYVLSADDKRVLKALQPPAGIWTDEQMQSEIQAFLQRAKTQQTLAKSSQNWAPIHEAAAIREGTEGSSGGGEAAGDDTGAAAKASGAFVVMDRYQRTIGALVDGRVHLNNDDLRNLMGGIVKGLRDIRQIAKRPHGNLKASNVLLADSTDLTRAVVHLTDPAVDSAGNSDQKDFSDLGGILYELVTLRPYQGGTVPRTSDWNDLGPNGEDWRKLCNTLLDVGTGGGTADDRDFDKMLAAIDTWRAKPQKNRKPLFIGAAVLLLLIVGAGAAWWFTREKPIDYSQANWERLCLTYYSWFDGVADMDEATIRKYAGSPYPTEVAKLLEGASKNLDEYQPRNISHARESYDTLAITPPQDAKTGLGPNYTKHGLEFIDKISQALTHWPVLTQLDATAKAYETRGWTRPAAGVRSLVQSAEPPPIPESPADIQERLKLVKKFNLVGDIEKVVTGYREVQAIDADWDRITSRIAQVQAIPGNVPLLQAFKQFAEDLPKAQSAGTKPGEGTLDDVKNLSAAFAEINKTLDKLVVLNNTAYDLAELAKDPAAQVPADKQIAIDQYVRLLALADKDYKRLARYVPVTPPGQPPAPDVTDPHLLAGIEADIGIIVKANPGDEHLSNLKEHHDALANQIAALDRTPPISKNAAAIKNSTDAIVLEFRRLTADSSSWSAPYKIKPEEYIAAQKRRIGEGLVHSLPLREPPYPAGYTVNAAVEEQWRKASTALLAKVEAAPNDLKDWTKFKQVEDKFKNLDAIYADFDSKMVPPKDAGLSAFLQEARPDWKSAIASRIVTAYRDQARTDLMTNPALKWPNDLPLVTDPAYQSFARERTAAFDKLCRDAHDLIIDFSTIASRLDRLDLLANEPAKNDPTWRDLAAKWKDSRSPLLADTAIAGELKPITDRVAALLSLDSVKDYKALAADALSAAPEIALTAWRKLATVPLSENLPVLDDEDKAEAHVASLLAARAKTGVLDNQRVSSLAAEMKAQRTVRWRRYADVLSSPAAMEGALARRADFAVTLSAADDPALFYDDLLYGLRVTFSKNPPDAQLKQAGRNFIDEVRNKLPAVARDPGVQDLLNRMDKSLATNVQESSAAGAGPKLAGWEQENPSPEVRLFYYPNKAAAKEVLEFSRIQAGQKTVYLCTAEVSFGVFAQVINDANCLADLDNAGKPEAQAHWFKTGDEPWDGPRVWKIANRKFVANDDWLVLPPTMLGPPPIPAYPGAAPDKPGPEQPMQQITPWAAMYFARLLGCRLPTSDEWKAAYEKSESGAGGQRDAWNLRGAAWLAQQEYARKIAAKGLQYPDQGIFLQPDQLFAGITADAAKPWQSRDLAKLAPARITDAAGVYPTSQLWFRKVGAQPGVSPPGQGKGGFHDLVGNVAEYVFDAPGANAVTKDTKVSVDSVNALIGAESKDLFVIGGSSLSPPEVPDPANPGKFIVNAFNVKQPVPLDFAQTSTGFSDVGFRLAYTAPVDSIADVLASAFKAPPYLPPSKTPR